MIVKNDEEEAVFRHSDGNSHALRFCDNEDLGITGMLSIGLPIGYSKQ